MKFYKMCVKSGLVLLFIAGSMFKKGNCRSRPDPVSQAACRLECSDILGATETDILSVQDKAARYRGIFNLMVKISFNQEPCWTNCARTTRKIRDNRQIGVDTSVSLPPQNLMLHEGTKRTPTSIPVGNSPNMAIVANGYFVTSTSRSWKLNMEPNVDRIEEYDNPEDDYLKLGKTIDVTAATLSEDVHTPSGAEYIISAPPPVENLAADIVGYLKTVVVSWDPGRSSTQDSNSYKLSYYVVERQTDVPESSIVNQTKVTLYDLLPGWNYSISVRAISNKSESTESMIHLVTHPASPTSIAVESVEEGLIVSWTTDVKSRQEKFEIGYKMIYLFGANFPVSIFTTKSPFHLKNLYPGRSYQIQVIAISCGKESGPVSKTQTVVPRPPRNMSIEKVWSNGVLVRWEMPQNSSFTAFVIRYRTGEDNWWRELRRSLHSTNAQIDSLKPGELYIIRINTVSALVESFESLQVNQTTPPKHVLNLTATCFSTNVVLEWLRPEGKIETYSIEWWQVKNSADIHTKNVTENDVSAVGFEDGSRMKRELIIGDLIPGVQYLFSIHAVSHNSVSDVASRKATMVPLIQSQIVAIINEDSDSLTIIFTPTQKQTSYFDYYRFSISDSEKIVTVTMVDDTENNVTITGLTPGKLYNVNAFVVSNNVESQPLLWKARLAPDRVSSIHAVEVGDTEITLKWDVPQGEYDTFEVQCRHPNETIEAKLIKITTYRTSINITGLRPYQNYTFIVTVISGTDSNFLQRSNPVEAIFTTSESRPGQIVIFEPSNVAPRNITFIWSLPSQNRNGIIRRFIITYGLEGSPRTRAKSFEPNECRGVIESLIPGKTYVFNIQAETKVGLGPDKIWKQKMPILAPPQPRPEDVPTNLRTSSNLIETRIRKDYFSEEDGAIISYSIIVVEDHGIDASGLKLRSWYEVQEYRIWPPYEVKVRYNLFKDGLLADFRIGDDDCVKETDFCNGPLKSGSTYRVKLRGFTAPDKFADTNYSLPIETKPTAGDGLNAMIAPKVGNISDIHVTWDRPESFPDFYIINVTLNGSKSDDPPFHNISGTATKTVFSDVATSEGFIVYVRAWTSDIGGLIISKRFKSLPKSIRQTDLVIPLCLTGGIAVLIGIGITVCGYFRIRRRRSPSQNRQLDEYEMSPGCLTITRVLGNGAFGIVKLGRLRDDQGNLTNVAVKMLRDDSNENDLRSFLDEIKIMKALDKHRNIVSLVGCCTIGQYPFLVVEYCSRGDLQSFLRKSLEEATSPVDEAMKCTVISKKLAQGKQVLKKNCEKSSTSRSDDDYVQVSCSAGDQDTHCDPDVITVLDMLNFGRQIATGMVFLSSNRIVHRDLATRNVLVCYDRTVKISDFGLSRDIYQENVYKKSGTGRMPLKWMAIEALTHQVYSTYSDIWSFGILLWEIVTLGGVPYPEISTMELLKRLQSGYRMERPENCSIPLYDVMLSCWQTRPRDRPTFTMLRQELGRLISVTTENEYLDLNDVLDQVSPGPSSPRLQNRV